MGTPRLRTEHQLSIRPDGRLQIGALPGIASILPDPDGWRLPLLRLLDGTRTTAEVLRAMETTHPDVPYARIGDLLTDLIQAGHLQDSATAKPPAELNPEAVQRRQRTTEYLEMIDRNPGRSGWDLQHILTRSVVTVVGAGGTGLVAAAALAGAGIGRLVLADPDRVEASNLSRQHLYTTADIGRPKVDAAFERLAERHPGLDVVAIPEQVTLQAQFARLMRGCDLLICAADEPDGLRLTANRAALDTGCPWVDPGYHGPVISTTLFAPGGDLPCWECLRHGDALAHGLPGIHADVPPAALPRTIGHPVTAITAGLAGHYAAHAAITHLTGTREFAPSTVHRHSLIAPAGQPLAPITYPRNPHCPSCSTSTTTTRTETP
ncbi:HesA/MoeB/ThiF family protein [Kitasatospora sp. NPDC101447]|uniref:HesA/MoeB/ThiF family protein n=1 Tax=Kitasatospora sp. NPDC101447 TaxID=3364102 RepID=UPI0037FC6308